MEPFICATTRSLDLDVGVRIDTLEGQKPPLSATTLLEHPELKHVGSNTSGYSDLYVTVQVYADNKPLTVPVQTSYKSFRSQRQWLEWLRMPIRYRDLPLSSQLAITVWDLAGPLETVPFGGTTIKLFEKDNTLKKGRQKCKIWMGKEADGRSDSTTPSPAESNDEMERLEKLMKKHEFGDMNRLDWLDNLAFRQIEKINKTSPSSKAGEHFLYIDFPRFDFPIVYSDYEYPVAHPNHTSSTPSDSTQLPNQHPGGGVAVDGTTGARNPAPRVICKVYDPEVGRDNPCEAMHRRLMRSQRNGPVDRDLKPNSKVRDELNQIMEYSPTHELSPEEKDLVWKFRFYLTRDKRALTKFVKSVSWSDAAEVKQAVSLVYKWTEVDIDDALELLGPEIKNPDIRAYAVERLGSADDEELQLYLLQLVQALKFERTMTSASIASPDSPIPLSRLATFLIDRAASNPQLGSYFYWYLLVEIEDPDSERKRLYSKVNYEFQLAMRKLPNGDATRAVMKRQGDFIFLLGNISTELEKVRDRTKKEERLKEILSDPKAGLLSFDPIPLPLDPTITITGCFPEKSMIFKSSLYPMLLYLKTSTGDQFPVIFKSGDDLRQDQLVIQIIILMDRLLRHENLDLKLTPYRILATSAFTGLVQFIPSMSLAAIEDPRKNPSGKPGVLNYLRHHHPDPNAPFGIEPSVIDTYIKSCAGYCVITYILGVGDRHLDNLLLSPSGHFFHADFGYILGRDPKPFAPPLKLCSEMVAGMGGVNSDGYNQFKQYCFTTFVGLRKNARLVLNLFALMRDANVPDIRLEPDKAVGKVRAKFELGDEEGGGQKVSEEEAVRRFEEVLERSLGSLMPVLLERVHKVAQRWRS